MAKAKASARTHDTQRSRVYAWEGVATKGAHYIATWKTLEQVEAFMNPIWRKERGRVGLANQRAPEVSRNLWGQRRAVALSTHVLKFPMWARNPWVVLHEMAHRLTPGDRHGPRFVGVLIGLVCRHLDYDANELMRLADEGGVKYSVRSIGLVPVHGPAWHVARALREEEPMSAMDLACWLSIGCGVDITVVQVRGAALPLIRRGDARWLRGKLVSLIQETAPVERKTPRAPGPNTTSALAKTHGITIEREGKGYAVWPPANIDDLGDPFEGDHGVGDWGAVDLMVRRYVEILTGVWPVAEAA